MELAWSCAQARIVSRVRFLAWSSEGSVAVTTLTELCSRPGAAQNHWKEACALWVRAAWAHLLRCACSTMNPHRFRPRRLASGPTALRTQPAGVPPRAPSNLIVFVWALAILLLTRGRLGECPGTLS